MIDLDAEVREELRKLGIRRKRQRRNQARLREDTETVMKRLPRTSISISEACNLAGISRSSVYDEYNLASD